MKCPHCSIGVNIDWLATSAYSENVEESKTGKEILHGECPECGGIVIRLVEGPLEWMGTSRHVDEDNLASDTVVYPLSNARPVEKEVPEEYKQEFLEACSVLTLSPKASAALGRRLLQNILRNRFGIKDRSLAAEIEAFINLNGIPSHLSGAIDAVRNVGNFAAHPLKDTNTGEILDVEPGEAEWLLDVLESLLDFAFVQPIRLKERKAALNEKLKAMGKPPMKG